MKKHISVFIILISCFSASAQSSQISLQISSSDIQISKHIYGHFAEHLGRCVYDGFYVGEGNTQIANIDGVRFDIIEALKKLKVPNLRWPGGCFADTYHWMDGIGDKSKRPKLVNVWWGGVTEDNSFGTHDFLNMCEQIGTEPYLAANVGSGTVKELADWIQYVNFSGVSPMSILRQENGREKPWNVKYWGVGNEAWGCGGNMKAEHYANLYRQYATYMMDQTEKGKIFRIASGASSSDYNWTEVLMREIPQQLVDGLALHHYAVIDWNNKGSATEFTEQQYFTTMKRALEMEELVTRHSTIMDKYDPAKKIALVVDEWGGWYDVEKGTNPGFLYQQNTMRDAMIAGVTLNIFNNHADRVRMANLAQTVNVLQAVVLTQGNKLILTPTYHVMEMYSVHQDANLLPIKLKSDFYQFGSEKLPALSASASVDEFGKVHLSVVNIDAKKTQQVTIELWGSVFKNATGRILTSARVTDHNTFDSPNVISPKAFNNFVLKKDMVTLNVPPFSVVVLELQK